MTADRELENLAHQYLDLLAERVGGRAIACSDQWFASCDNLVKPGRGVFREGHFVSTGQWMDGWESRRSFGRRGDDDPDFDWCVLRLGVAGEIHGFDIDTNHFRGNAPEQVAVEAARLSHDPKPGDEVFWTEILPTSPVQAHSRNLFHCDSDEGWTHVRLRMFPDGGIARFRVYGTALINPQHFLPGELVDLAAAANGGRGIAASDMFYSSPSNLVMPGRGVNMGDGWETKRRRDGQHDWAIIQLGVPGTIRKVLVDTAHFKGNYPDRFSLAAVNAEGDDMAAADIHWRPVLSEQPLDPDKEHLYVPEIMVPATEIFTHVRVSIYPDGGLSRLRIFGEPDWQRSGAE